MFAYNVLVDANEMRTQLNRYVEWRIVMPKELPENAKKLAQFLRELDHGLAVGKLMLELAERSIKNESDTLEGDKLLLGEIVSSKTTITS